MAEGVNITEELFADSDSNGEENFEGFDLEESETSRNAPNNLDDGKYNILDEKGFPKIWHSITKMACKKILITPIRLFTFLNYFMKMIIMNKSNQ